MGNFLSDMVGIEGAGQDLAEALKEAEANATIEFRNIALTAINYVKSFTPVISLMVIFLILLLFVSILSILSRMLDDLEVSRTVRRRILFIISIILYLWFLIVQILAAVKQKTSNIIAISAVAGAGLIIIFILFIWSHCRTSKESSSKPNNDVPMDGIL